MVETVEHLKWFSKATCIPDCILDSFRKENLWSVTVFWVPVLQYRGQVPDSTGFNSKFLLFNFLVCGCILMVSIVGPRFFPKKGKPESYKITALCGAVCSECSYFLEGHCPSCPEGDPELQDQCSIFECALKKGVTCTACDTFLECTIFIRERENCPFEKEFFPLQIGMGYVIYEKDPEKSIHLFRDHVNRGESGLLVFRQFPEQVKAKHQLENVASIWLSTAEGEENWIDPCNLSKLNHYVCKFLENTSFSVILFEGFEYIMVRNSFLNALKFLQSLMDEIILGRSRLVLTINPEAFSKRELALIRRELIEL